MLAFLALLARPLIGAGLSIVGHVALDLFRAWKASEDARALGRAEAGREATETVLRVEREMSNVDLIGRDSLIKRLREADW
jgi:hypothetical protein